MTSAPSWAIPGAKVVCVNANGSDGCLIVGGIYVIDCVRTPFIEICGVGEGESFRGLWPDRFRPLTKSTQEQDLDDYFRPILDVEGEAEIDLAFALVKAGLDQ
jgi:hypothetical protein